MRRVGLARSTTIAGVVGISLAALFPGRYLIAVCGLTVALAGMLAGHVLSRWHPSSAAGLGVIIVAVLSVGLLAGLLLGTLRIGLLLDGALPARVGEKVRAEVVVTGPVRASSGWQSAIADVRAVDSLDAQGAGSSDSRGEGETVLLEVAPPKADTVGRPAIFQGAVLSVAGALAAPEGPSSSGFDQATQLLHQGIQVVLTVEADDVSIQGRRGGASGWFDRLRESARQHLSLGPNARVNEVLQGVVMGDTLGIDEGWMEAFRRSGTAHMLSVSGLHVASLAAIVLALAGLVRLSRRVGYLLAAGAALLMIPFVGASPPIVRAGVMMLVVLGGRLVGRRRDQWQGLAFAAFVVLIPNPFAVFDVGFQLSFSAFAGMIALVRPIERLLGRLPDSVRTNLAVSVAATLGTAPVSLLVFGRTSLIAPVANLLVVPTLASVTGLGMASVVFGLVWPGFSVALDTLASLPMMWTILVSSLCARAPVVPAAALGSVLLALPAAAAVLPVALALAGRSVRLPLGARLPLFERSLAWLTVRRPKGRRRSFVLACAVMICALAVGSASYPAGMAGARSVQLMAGHRGWPSELEIRVLDVGQGNAILVRTPEHHAALFDGGPAGCGLESQLRTLGVRRLDLVVISHPHADHFAGLVEALDSLHVGMFIDCTEVIEPGASQVGPDTSVADRWTYQAGGEAGADGEAGEYLQLRRRLAQTGCRIERAGTGSSLTLDRIRISFFAPARPLILIDQSDPWGEGRSPPSGDEMNGASLVTLLETGRARVLLPGDAEASALDEYPLPALDAIVVPHHGSRGAVTKGLLTELHPRLAVISVGRGNPFGHPDRTTIGTLGAAGETVCRTDESGWVSLRVKDEELSVFTERTRAR